MGNVPMNGMLKAKKDEIDETENYVKILNNNYVINPLVRLTFLLIASFVLPYATGIELQN